MGDTTACGMTPTVRPTRRVWLRKAADDLRGAEIDLAAVLPLTGDAAFHRSPNLIRLTSS